METFSFVPRLPAPAWRDDVRKGLITHKTRSLCHDSVIILEEKD